MLVGERSVGDHEMRVSTSAATADATAPAAAAAAEAAPSVGPELASTRYDSNAVPMHLLSDVAVLRAGVTGQPATNAHATAKPHTMPKNFYAYLTTVVVALLTLVLGILIPMMLLQRSAAAQNAVLRAKEATAGAAWAVSFRTAMIDALAITRSLQDFIVGTFPSLIVPHWVDNGTKTANYLANFAGYAALLAELKPDLALMTVSPGGVVAMTYPYDAASIGRNLLSPTDPSNEYSPTPLQTVEEGIEVFLPPLRSAAPLLKHMWVVLARIPIYNNTQSPTRTLANFWGFVSLSVNVSRLLVSMQLQSSASELDMDYVLFTTPNATSVKVIASSFAAKLTNSEAVDFIADSTIADVLSPFSTLQIAVRSRKTYASLTPSNITLILLLTLLGTLTLFAATVVTIQWSTKEYDAARHAPKMAPFAMLAVGPYRGAELWDLVPGVTVEVAEKLTAVLERQMERHGAVRMELPRQHAATYVTRHVSSAVQMAFSVIEELERHPIDTQLRAVLGEDAGRLEVCCAVHWCTDAAVRVESLQGSYRYEGPDVVFGGRMWAFAAPGVVTASAAVVEQLPCRGLVGVEAHAYQTVESPQSARNAASDGIGGRDTAPAEGATPSAAPWGGVGSRNTVPLYLLICPSRPHHVAAATQAIAATVMCGPTLMYADLSDPCASMSPLSRINSSPYVSDGVLPRRAEHACDRSHAAICRASGVWEGAMQLKPRGKTRSTRAQRAHSPSSHSPVRQNPLDISVAREEAGTVVVAVAAASGSPRWGGTASLSAAGVRRLSADRSSEAGSGGGSGRARSTPAYVPADALTRALLQPIIPRFLDVALHCAFEYQSIRGVSYDEVRTLSYYFYSSYAILFRPLAGPERHNIFRRLVSAFGVPQQGILEHLAVRGAAQWLLQVRKLHLVPHLCNPDALVARAPPYVTMLVTSVSDGPRSCPSEDGM